MSKRKKRFKNFLWLIVPFLLFFVVARYLFAASGEAAVIIRNDKIQNQIEGNITDYEWKGKAVVTLWFDDAWASQYEEGFTLVEEYGFKAALSVPTRLIGYEAYMNWYQIRKLHYLGWEIVSHSASHNCDLVEGSELEIGEEILGGRVELLQLGGIDSDIYVAPCGKKSEHTTKLVQNNFRAQRLVDYGVNELPLDDMYALKVVEIGNTITPDDVEEWIKEAKLINGWLILMFHQIDYDGQDYGTTPDVLSEILEVVNESGLDVVLPSQVLNI